MGRHALVMLYGYKAEVLRVIDGDTIDVCVDLGMRISRRVRLRLQGIDTPEIRHARTVEELEHGRAAKQWLEENCGVGSKIMIRTYQDPDIYDRYTAMVLYGPQFMLNLTKQLKKEGFSKRDTYKDDADTVQ